MIETWKKRLTATTKARRRQTRPGLHRRSCSHSGARNLCLPCVRGRGDNTAPLPKGIAVASAAFLQYPASAPSWGARVLEHGDLARIGFGAGEQRAFCTHGEGDIAASDGEEFHSFLQVEETQYIVGELNDAVLGDICPAV